MKRIISIIGLSGAMALLAQCGLERSLVVWSAPGYSSSTEFSTQADHEDDADRLFLGYELYYKIGFDINDFDSENITDVNQLALNGYRRLHFADDKFGEAYRQFPLYLTDGIGEGAPTYVILIDYLTDISSVVIKDEASIYHTYEIRRDVYYGEEYPETKRYQYKKFSEFYNGDSDISDQTFFDGKIEDQSYPVWINIYVYAYGQSINSATLLRDINSAPTRLGPTQVSIVYASGLD